MGGSQRSSHGLVCLFLLFNGCALEPVGTVETCGDLLPGDVVITEVHANPRGADADAEYVELYNASGSVRLLDGATLVTSRADGTSPETHRLASMVAVGPGDYFVAGKRCSRPAACVPRLQLWERPWKPAKRRRGRVAVVRYDPDR